ncbi:MAG: VCBS repeat-containing protein [Verrucomicrobiales bacterium]|nr:VCBS repeat-containing protein [Verrucomicrobiales bacterium]
MRKELSLHREHGWLRWSAPLRAFSYTVLIASACLELSGCNESINPCVDWQIIVRKLFVRPDGNVVETYVITRASPRRATYFYRGPGINVADLCAEANKHFGFRGPNDPNLSGASRSTSVSLQQSSGAPAVAPTSFVTFNDYAAGVVFEDLNGDGDPDVALALQGASRVTILLSAGDKFLPPMEFPTGTGLSVVQAGDVNHDGVLDLVAANQGKFVGSDFTGGDVSLLLGNGDGTFRAPISIEAGKVPRDIGLGDFNRDGKLDLAVADTPTATERSVLVRLGHGDGTFQPATAIAAPGLEALTVADLNVDVDSYDDIVTNGSILLGRGEGTFAPAVAFPVGYNITLNTVAVGDLNADRKPDVVVGAFDNELVSVFLGNGDGTLRSARHYAVQGQPQQIQIADRDGDGLTDILVSNSTGGGANLFGRGDGSFHGAELHAGVANPSGRGGASGVAVADFTSDGVPDMVVKRDARVAAGTWWRCVRPHGQNHKRTLLHWRSGGRRLEW